MRASKTPSAGCRFVRCVVAGDRSRVGRPEQAAVRVGGQDAGRVDAGFKQHGAVHGAQPALDVDVRFRVEHPVRAVRRVGKQIGAGLREARVQRDALALRFEKDVQRFPEDLHAEDRLREKQAAGVAARRVVDEDLVRLAEQHGVQPPEAVGLERVQVVRADFKREEVGFGKRVRVEALDREEIVEAARDGHGAAAQEGVLAGVFGRGAARAVRRGNAGRAAVGVGEKLGAAAGRKEQDGGVRRDRAGQRAAFGTGRRGGDDAEDESERERRGPQGSECFFHRDASSFLAERKIRGKPAGTAVQRA